MSRDVSKTTPAASALARYEQARMDGGHTGRWRMQAHEVIAPIIGRCFDGTNAMDVLAVTAGNYPFGLRKHYPYKAWLKERRYAMQALGLREMDVQAAKRAENVNQMNLWEGNE